MNILLASRRFSVFLNRIFVEFALKNKFTSVTEAAHNENCTKLSKKVYVKFHDDGDHDGMENG